MASITDRGNGTFLVRVYNGVKNGKPQSVAVTFKANAGSSPAVARRAAEKYAALFEELVHSDPDPPLDQNDQWSDHSFYN